MGLIDKLLGRRLSVIKDGKICKAKILHINGKDYINLYNRLYELCYEDGIIYRVDDLLKRDAGRSDYTQGAIVKGIK